MRVGPESVEQLYGYDATVRLRHEEAVVRIVRPKNRSPELPSSVRRIPPILLVEQRVVDGLLDSIHEVSHIGVPHNLGRQRPVSMDRAMSRLDPARDFLSCVAETARHQKLRQLLIERRDRPCKGNLEKTKSLAISTMRVRLRQQCRKRLYSVEAINQSLK